MFLPITDIFETEDALDVLVEMPGVERGNVDISVKDRILTIYGRIDFQKYAGMTPLYTEYNIGNFHRRFSLSNKVDASNIRAEMRDGLLTLTILARRKPRHRGLRSPKRHEEPSPSGKSLVGTSCKAYFFG